MPHCFPVRYDWLRTSQTDGAHQSAGAMVYVDRQPLGASPASTQFTYWGSRHIEVVGDGYRTEKVIRTFYPPWYQIPPFDFVAETLWPWEIKAYREVDITMVPEPNVANEELIARADDLRTQAAAGVAVPINRTQGPADVIRTPVLPPGNSPPPYVPPAAIGSDALVRPVQPHHRLSTSKSTMATWAIPSQYLHARRAHPRGRRTPRWRLPRTRTIVLIPALLSQPEA